MVTIRPQGRSSLLNSKEILQQDDSQVSLVSWVFGSGGLKEDTPLFRSAFSLRQALGKRCLNTSCDSMDRRVFDQGLGPHLVSQTVGLGEQMHGMSLGRVWSVMSSGPHPSCDSTDDHL